MPVTKWKRFFQLFRSRAPHLCLPNPVEKYSTPNTTYYKSESPKCMRWMSWPIVKMYLWPSHAIQLFCKATFCIPAADSLLQYVQLMFGTVFDRPDETEKFQWKMTKSNCLHWHSQCLQRNPRTNDITSWEMSFDPTVAWKCWKFISRHFFRIIHHSQLR